MGHTASAQHLRWTVPSVGDEGVSATLPHPRAAAEKRRDGGGCIYEGEVFVGEGVMVTFCRNC